MALLFSWREIRRSVAGAAIKPEAWRLNVITSVGDMIWPNCEPQRSSKKKGNYVVEYVLTGGGR